MRVDVSAVQESYKELESYSKLKSYSKLTEVLQRTYRRLSPLMPLKVRTLSFLERSSISWRRPELNHA